jgi:DNA polymerase III epsilon subunit-like protein
MPATAFDTETELIAPGNQAPHLICLTWTDQHGGAQIIHWKQAYEIARELILGASAENPLVGHNAAFDLCVLARQFPDLMPLIFEAYERDAILDTAVAEKLLDIAEGRDRSGEKRPYALDSLAERYFDLTLDKETWRLRYGELKEIGLHEWPHGAKDYALTDAKTTLEIFKVQRERALPDLPAQCRADFALRLASNHGIITCPKAVSKFSTQIKEEFEQVRVSLLAGGLLKTQKRRDSTTYVRNTKLAQERLGSILGSGVARTPSGLVQVDEDSCVASKDPQLIAYNRFTKLQTLTSKDCAILERGTKEPIHTYFNVLVNTGRTSSRSPNMQNPRREPGVRECFVPRDGFVFASADYEAAELHTLGQVCVSLFRFSTLAKQLNKGIDPHLNFASQLLRIDYDEALARKKAGDPQIAETRQMAKAANFGFPGGMGPTSFRAYAKGYGFLLSLDEASDLRKKWLASFPEMEKYFKFISGLCKNSRLANIKHLFTNRVRAKVNYTAACNSFFQGLAADGAKRALFEVQRHCQALPTSPLFGSHVVNFLHDEIMLEVPEDRGHEAAHELADIMVREFNHFVPDVPVRASPQLMRCWSKNAKPVYDSQGRLIPWQPKETQ